MIPTTSHPASSPAWPDQAASDQDLLAGLGRGDRRASGAFVRRFERRVYGLAKAIVGDSNHAEDIAQEALSRAWRHAQAYDSRRGSVATWVLSITHNLAVDSLRRRSPLPIDPHSVVFLERWEQGATPEERAGIAGDTEEVRAALSQIPAEQRRAVVLAAFYGRTAQQIGIGEGIPLGTAKTRIRSGLIKLRGLLGQGGAPSASKPLAPAWRVAVHASSRHSTGPP
jgi:RNA polymerase sigma factor (sigma-70 family)